MKKKLFWILYFGVAIGGVTLAAVLLPEYIVFNWYSLFPLGYMTLNIVFAFIAASELPNKFWNWKLEHQRIYFSGGEVDKPRSPTPYNRQYSLTSAKIILAFLPIWFWFIIFFTSKAKIVCGMILFVFLLTEAIHLTVDDELSAKKERKEREEELKKQISREQEGKWK